MLLRYYSGLLLLLFLPHLSTPATCPYDIDYASRIVPPTCYANATSHSATGCCWYVFAAYIYAATRHANLTGAAFLTPSTASVCSSAFSSSLIRRGLVLPSLLLSGDSCNLAGDPVRLAAGNRPCQFPTVSAIRSAVDLSSAVPPCASYPQELTSNQTACVTCQNAVIASTLALLDATNSKEFVPCGMAATIGIWSSSLPEIRKFRSYALCMVQILENVGNLGTGNLLPSPPTTTSTGTPPPPATGDSRSVKIAAGSASAGIVSIAAIAYLVLAIRRKRRSTLVTTVEDQDRTAVFGSPLPTEGLYIFTKSELKHATNGYDEKLLLGEGGAGKVYLGKLPSGQHVAIKRINREKKIGEFYREVEILAKLRHRNLATLVGYCLGEREHVLVYEYMSGGNLARALYHGELMWHRRVRIAVDVAEGLAYLHEFPDGAVVHRDVKPTNVLLNDAWQAKLSDFGVSRIVPSGISHVSTGVKGTMGYVDPEFFSVGHVSEATDVYSFGIVLLELVTGMKAVVPTVSGGAESIVHTAHSVMTATEGGDGEAEVGAIVDPRLGPEWDQASVWEVFKIAYRCVKPYKNERPRMTEVLAVLKGVVRDIETRAEPSSVPGDVESSPLGVSNEYTAPSTSRGSTSSVHAWSL